MEVTLKLQLTKANLQSSIVNASLAGAQHHRSAEMDFEWQDEAEQMHEDDGLFSSLSDPFLEW